MTSRDFFIAITIIFLWGLNIVAVKIGAVEFPPIFLTSIRFAAVSALLVPFFKPPKTALPHIALLSLTLGVCHFGFIFIGIKEADASTTAIILQLGTPFSIILAMIFFKEKISLQTAFGLFLAFLGTTVIAGEPKVGNIIPLLFIVASAFSWAVSNLILKRLSGVNVLAINGYMGLFAIPQLLLLSYFFEEGQVQAIENATWKGWCSLAYLVIAASIIAHSLWYYLIKKHDVSRITPFILLSTVVAMFSSILILGEELTLYKAVGGTVVITGIAVIEFYKWKKLKTND
ncbi:MAG: EamA family transporter [Alphaproteobacteria bacterium]|nr:EamA family transporter [Alphaproteobacteria bacterium]